MCFTFLERVYHYIIWGVNFYCWNHCTSYSAYDSQRIYFPIHDIGSNMRVENARCCCWYRYLYSWWHIIAVTKATIESFDSISWLPTCSLSICLKCGCGLSCRCIDRERWGCCTSSCFRNIMSDACDNSSCFIYLSNWLRECDCLGLAR